MEFVNIEVIFKKIKSYEYCLVFRITVVSTFKNRSWVLILQSMEVPTSVLPSAGMVQDFRHSFYCILTIMSGTIPA